MGAVTGNLQGSQRPPSGSRDGRTRVVAGRRRAVGSGAGRPAKVRVYRGTDFASGGGESPAAGLGPFGGAVLADGVYVG
jgi:hypothetical protein